jgi:glycerol-3-phosphate acyltransferase PlsY
MAITISVITTVTAILVAYFMGSISSAVIVSKIMGLPDPRTHGSHNPGATNVLRIGGKKAGAITLLGDTLKGFIPVYIAILLKLDTHTISMVMFAVFFGHLYPIFFRGEGGKGVATLIGTLLALNWMAGCAFLETWIIMAVIFRYASVASITAALLAPFFVWFYTGESAFYITVIIMAIILLLKHKSNIANLVAGKEQKLGAKTQVKSSSGQRARTLTPKSSRSPKSKR